MPTFQPGQWIKTHTSSTPYRILFVHPNGQLVVEDPTGQMRILTRPEHYYRTSPPDDQTQPDYPGKTPR